MPSIQELPEEVWTRVAAGEVVERPASAVKELVENALDAGAKRVRVRLWDGGRLRIVVEDDGCGIAMEELPLALLPHATSKLARVEDLEAIRTLGYRGEALASLTAVAGVEIRSRVRDSAAGGLVRASGGRVTEHQATSCALGTRVQVDELFGNLPARRKFLKSAAGELRRAAACLREYAVCRPDVAFILEHDGREVLSTGGDGGPDQELARRRVLEQLWGKEPEIRSVTAAAAHLALECWQQASFGGKIVRNDIMAFVNGRAVNDPVVKGAVSAAARDLTGNWALFFALEPALVDVNIHPAKAEVRFRYPGEVFEAVREAAEQLSGPAAFTPPQTDTFLSSDSAAFSIPVSRPGTRGGPGHTIARPGWNFREGPAPREDSRPIPPREVPAPVPPPVGKKPDPPAPFLPIEGPVDGERYLGQMASGYLLFDTPEGLAVMDPHAAHERVAYERIQASEGTQALLAPILLPPTLSLEVEEYEAALGDFGLQRRDGGLYLTAVPSFSVGKAEPEALLRSSLAALKQDRDGDPHERLWRAWATMACKSAVKLTDRLSREEALALWRDLRACRQPFRCPHGRPTLLTLTPEDLRRHFGRE